VLRELYEQGLRFDIVAGTSVGALNGAIVATDSWETGDGLWTGLSFGKAFAWSGLGGIVTILLAPAMLYGGWLTQEMDFVLPRWLRQLFAILSMPWLYALALLGIAAVVESSLSIALKVLCVAIVIGVLVQMNELIMRVKNSPRGVFAATGWVVSFIMTLTVLGIPHRPHSPFAVVGEILILNLALLLFVLSFLQEWLNAAMLSNSPLQSIVDRVVARGLNKPLIATAGERVTFSDPDDHEYALVGRGRIRTIIEQTGFCPSYLRVDRLPASESVPALLTSAALPIGIVRHSAKFGTQGVFVDGGVIDNIPWFPLIDEYPCEEVFVVLCDPPSESTKPSRSAWTELDRRIRVMRSGFRQPAEQQDRKDVHNVPPSAIPSRAPLHWNSTDNGGITIIGPSESLGNFLTATLNFGGQRARENYARGRSKVREMISSGQITL
jgi:hypothetical protein